MLLFPGKLERQRYSLSPDFQPASVAASLCEARWRRHALVPLCAATRNPTGLRAGRLQSPPTARRLQAAAVLREQLQNALLIGLTDPTLRDKPGHQLPRGDIESKIGGGAGLGRHANLDLLAFVQAIGVVHFFRATLLDRDFL